MSARLTAYGTVTVYCGDNPQDKSETEVELRRCGHSWTCVRRDGRLEFQVPITVYVSDGVVAPS